MALTYEIVAKDKIFAGPRDGELHQLYLDLVKLSHHKPDSKMVVTFPTRQRGERAVKRMAAWCVEDGYELYHATLPGTPKRQMWLEEAVKEQA